MLFTTSPLLVICVTWLYSNGEVRGTSVTLPAMFAACRHNYHHFSSPNVSLTHIGCTCLYTLLRWTFRGPELGTSSNYGHQPRKA